MTSIQTLLSPLMESNGVPVCGGRTFSRTFSLLGNLVVLFVPDDRCEEISITVTQSENVRKEEVAVQTINKNHDQIFSEVALAINKTLDRFNHNEMKDFLQLYEVDIGSFQ